MKNMDIRWVQRFNNFKKAFEQLERFVARENLNELEEQGLIQSFEYTYELSWKTLQDLLKERGYLEILGPRPVIEQSFQNSYLSDGEAWMLMLRSRSLTSHTYNEDTAKEIVKNIRSSYFDLFKQLYHRLEEELDNDSL